MDAFVQDYVGRVVDAFVNPQKRVFAGYLAAALFIALGVHLVILKSTFRQALAEIFARRIWLSRSAVADYKILFINQAVMMGVGPRLLTKLAVATFLFQSLHVWADGRPTLWPEAPGWVIAGLFTLTLFVLDDLAKYLVHRALHRWPALWAFHKVHHTAETLTPLTVYRTHPMEGVIFGLRAVFVQGTVVALFLFYFGDRTELATVLGANAFLFLFNLAGANLRHSHVWLSYGSAVERFLISPAQHQIHHSLDPRHFDRNFGSVLAVWDRLGGSLCLAEGNHCIRFGVADMVPAAHDLRTLYLTPFADAARSLVRPMTKGYSIMTTLFASSPRRRSVAGAIALAAVLAGFAYKAQAAGELNIYSHRQPFLIEPFLNAYTKATGTKINIVYASQGLAQRLEAEGERSPADVILTVDIGRLWVYADKNLLAPVDSDILKKDVPANLRDPGNRWFAFSTRARVIAVSNKAADALKIKTYEELADPKWKGRICSRPGSHVYNRALVAAMIAAKGVEAAEAWAKGIVDNMARRPQGNDSAQLKAVAEGICDIALINNYYYGKTKASERADERAWAAAVTLIFPNQGDRGTHINISGGGVAKFAPHKAEAIRFLEFLTEETAQQLYGAVNFEYPVNPRVPAPPELASWGSFAKADSVPISKIAELGPEAQRVIDRVGW